MHKSCIFVGSPSPSLSQRIRALAGMESNLGAWMEWVAPSPAGARHPSPVLLIGADQLALPAWHFVRVRLAETGRFFIVVLPAGQGTAATVEALREGAYDAIAEDEPASRWQAALAAASDAEQLWSGLFGGASAPPADGLVGHSPGLQKLRDLIARIGPTSATVLILGESGTGKERVAEALHASHPNAKKRPFIAINCTALPRDLLEGELFGATKGAYTGAITDRPGLVEQAHGGTLFLDEIGDLDRTLQPKLLRFLETRRARRLGAKSDYAVDVRIVSATNANLHSRIAAGQFREDLYYRLADITLDLAPLRERAEDIPLLCRHFLSLSAERHGRLVTSIEPALLQQLQAWSWPGNIRELRSTIERLVLLAHGPVLREGAWSPPAPPRESFSTSPAPVSAPAPSQPPADSVTLNKRQRRDLALRLLEESGGDQAWVAARLGIHPTTLYRWRQQAAK